MGKRLTKEEFIEKAELKHGNTYDYSKVEYINNRTKVLIICKEHKDFLQMPGDHINGSGCFKCFGSYKKTTDDFIKKSIIKHGNQYDYSKVNYTGLINKVKIICKEHGEFEQNANDHMRGQGCRSCVKFSNSKFIKMCFDKHGDKYDYSKVNYLGSKSKIIVICEEHGEFEQSADSHLRGSGCFECSKINKSLSNCAFIKKAIVKHGNQYDYSKVKYVNGNTKVIIICKEHGEFEQNPNNHLNSKGCIKCAIFYKSSTTQEFLEKANIKHNNKYDYSNINYINAHIKINIICKEHGKFKQLPNSHLSGSGCYKCGLSYGLKENKWLDILGIKERQIKIKNYKVDGYDPITNTIYEFNGDFWHGNPNKYNPNDINKVSKKTFGELYKKTLERENKLKELGYNVISIWETDFDNRKI